MLTLKAICLIAVTTLASVHLHCQEITKIRLVFLGDTASDSWQGAMQGLEEANAQGSFLGYEYELLPARDENDALAMRPVSIIANLSPLRLMRLAERSGQISVLNVAAQDNELREACVENLFHTIPSSAMRQHAEQQWRRKSPSSRAGAKAWHRSFKKYAAAQLNNRYERSFGVEMSDNAWASWAAVKILSDLVVRLNESEPGPIGEALQEDLSFDGQKGITMSFRDTGQLRQPLLLVEDDRIVGEAPVAGIVNSSNLDSLGLAGCLK